MVQRSVLTEINEDVICYYEKGTHIFEGAPVELLVPWLMPQQPKNYVAATVLDMTKSTQRVQTLSKTSQ